MPEGKRFEIEYATASRCVPVTVRAAYYKIVDGFFEFKDDEHNVIRAFRADCVASVQAIDEDPPTFKPVTIEDFENLVRQAEFEQEVAVQAAAARVRDAKWRLEDAKLRGLCLGCRASASASNV